MYTGQVRRFFLETYKYIYCLATNIFSQLKSTVVTMKVVQPGRNSVPHFSPSNTYKIFTILLKFKTIIHLYTLGGAQIRPHNQTDALSEMSLINPVR